MDYIQEGLNLSENYSWVLIPVSRRPWKSAQGLDKGAKGALLNWKGRTALATKTMLSTWDRKYSQQPHGLALAALTEVSGFWALDEDEPGALDRLCSEHKQSLPATLMQTTPSGGKHLLFKNPPEGLGYVPTTTAHPAPGIDTRGRGGYIVIAPSVTDAGTYTWAEGHAPGEIQIAETPPWLLDLILAPKEDQTPEQSITRASTYIEKGTRHTQIIKQAGKWMALGYTRDEVKTFVRDAASNNRIEMGAGETLETLLDRVDSVYDSYKQKALLPTGDSDTDYAELFREIHGHEYDYSPDMHFRTYNGKIWEFDPDNVNMLFRADDVVRRLLRNAANEYDQKQRTYLWKQISYIKSLKGQRNMLVKARIHNARDLELERENQRTLVGAQNGVLDLETGQLLEHSPDFKLMTLANANYNPAADCPRWQAALNMYFEDDPEMIATIQRIMGYSITGLTDEQCLYIHTGIKSANGKSTFGETIDRVMGKHYTGICNPQTLMTSTGRSDLPQMAQLANLVNSRIVSINEPEQGAIFNGALVKQLTGSEKIIAKFYHQGTFSYTPHFKIHIRTNHRILIQNNEPAMWRRQREIPWLYHIPKERRLPEREIREQFDAERDGIFNWLIQGALAYVKNGMITNSKIEDATEDYRREMDAEMLFLEEACNYNPVLKVGRQHLYMAYVTWCQENTFPAMNTRAFSKRIAQDPRIDNGGTSENKKKYQLRSWYGLVLKEEYQLSEGEINSESKVNQMLGGAKQ